MIRRLSIRAKLGLLVTVPLLALVVVTIPGITSRIGRVQAEGRAHDLAAGPVAKLAAVVAAVQDEAALSTWFGATGDPQVRARLDTARATTDEQLATLPSVAAAARAADAGDTASRVERLQKAATQLVAMRTEVDARTATDESLVDTYRSIADATLRAIDSAAAAPHDTAAAANLRDTATLVRLANAAALERAIVLAAISHGTLPDSLANQLVAAVATQDVTLQTFLGQAGSDLQREYATRATGSSTAAAVEAMRNPVLARSYQASGFTPAQWYDTSSARVQELFDTVDAVRARTQALAETRRQQALEEALLYGGLAIVALVAAGVLTLAIARAIVRPLRSLTAAAREVSQRQLPHLVDALRHEDVAALPAIEPITIDSRDELGELAAAFNDISATTEAVARQQREVLHKGIGDLYLNLARRNQSLLERQFGVIDQLEADEEDPEKLDALFRIDHLATRMRRNAESLLVLAGLDEVRAHAEPVPIREVVRGALSEIVDYARVDVVGVSEYLSVRGDVAVDLSHAIAELLENAATFSPPQSRIFVSGERRGADYELTISDEGIGIAPDRVATLNQLLANPPLPGLHLSRSLGLVVVSRLAARIGAWVRLRSAPDVGTSAMVTIPVTLLIDRPESPVAAPAPTEPRPVDVAARATPTVADLFEEDEALPRAVRVARRRGRGRRGRGRGATPPRTPAEVSGPVATPESADVTASGLPKRTPTAPDGIDLTRDAPPLAPSPRPPDEVFELVARFEAGRRRVGRDASHEPAAGRDAAAGSAAPDTPDPSPPDPSPPDPSPPDPSPEEGS
jgi:signal transduction histidine kinase